MISVAYLGPPGTHTEEALVASAAEAIRPVPHAGLYDTVMAVHTGETDRAVVPIENSLEGGVAATLDTLAGDGDGVRIVAEVVYPIHHNLIGRPGQDPDAVTRVLSHPHATGQCERFLAAMLPRAERVDVASTAEAVHLVSQSEEPWAALASELAAERYGCEVLTANVEDRADNVTRFVWLAPADEATAPTEGPATTSIVFWGFNDESPGALVSVLGELSSRAINLTRIESRPRRVRLGHYMFFADLDGSTTDPHVAEALDALEGRVHELRLLGSYPSGPDRGVH